MLPKHSRKALRMFLKIRYSILDKVYLRCSYFTFGNRLKNINMSVVAYYN